MPSPPLWQNLQRLPGRAPMFLQFVGLNASLWLDDACLLLADSQLLRDSYRRFYYADIQALQLRRTSRGLVYNILALLGIVFCLLIFAAVNSRGAHVFWLGAAVVSAILLTINLLRGPTCRCQVQTAAGRVALVSLSRARAARRAFARIRERIAAAQGALPAPESVAQRLNLHLAQMNQRST
ncbi:MAG: hypothetical protein JO117_09705 [Verrucomicrobia bacterium]|nr:hypothetical protein [Verrucomicrobiota bacterium]